MSGLGAFAPDCRFDPESVEMLKQSFADLDILPTAPGMAKLYRIAFLPKK